MGLFGAAENAACPEEEVKMTVASPTEQLMQIDEGGDGSRTGSSDSIVAEEVDMKKQKSSARPNCDDPENLSAEV